MKVPLDYEYRVEKGNNSINPKYGSLTLKELLNNKCYVQCIYKVTESNVPLGIHDDINNFINVLKSSAQDDFKIEYIVQAGREFFGDGRVDLIYRFY